MPIEKLNEYYAKYESMFQETLEEFLPEKAEDSWVHRFAGDALFEWDERGITNAWLSPANSILKTATAAGSALLAALVLEGLDQRPDSFRPILAAAQISPAFTEMMRSFYYEGFSSLKKYADCGARSPAIAANISCGLCVFSYHIIRQKELGLGPEARLYLSEELVRDCNAFGVGCCSLLTWWQEREPLSDEGKYYQALIDTEINFRFRWPMKSAAISAGVSRREVEALAEFGDLLGLAGYLGQLADWSSSVPLENREGKEGYALMSSLFGLQEIPYRHLGEILYGKKDAVKANLLREKASDLANRAMAALDRGSLEGEPREILSALIDCAPHWSNVA